jgi:hypothetical protein
LTPTQEELNARDARLELKRRWGDLPYTFHKDDHKYLETLVLAEVLEPPRLRAFVAALELRPLLRLVSLGFAGPNPYAALKEGPYLLLQAAIAIAEGRGEGPFSDPLVASVSGTIACILRHVRSTYYDPGLFVSKVRSLSHGKLKAQALVKLDDALETAARKSAVTAYAEFQSTWDELDPQLRDAAIADLVPGLPLVQWFEDHRRRDGLAAFHKFVAIFGFRTLRIPEHLASRPDGGNGDVATWHVQLMLHLHELSTAFPLRYLEGMCRIISVLPTAGKRLDQLTWLSSMLEATQTMVELFNERYGRSLPETPPRITNAKDLPRLHRASTCPCVRRPATSVPAERKGGTSNALALAPTVPSGPYAAYHFPIYVFDQSKGAVAQQNADYIAGLVDEFDAEVVHVTWPDIVAMAKKTTWPSMFATSVDLSGDEWAGLQDADADAGYGGARNICYLLGPMVHRAMRLREGVGLQPILALGDEAARARLRACLPRRDFLLAGDDDVTVMPGFLHAKALLTERYADRDRIRVVTRLMGRGTVNLPVDVFDLVEDGPASQLGPGDFAPRAARAVALASWIRGFGQVQQDFVWPGQAGALMHVGACLDLPLPSEETHFSTYSARFDCLADTIHHAGDRFAALPTRLVSAFRYVAQVELGSRQFKTDLFPWNQAFAARPGDFHTFADVVRTACTPEAEDSLVMTTLHRFLTFEAPVSPDRQLQALHALSARTADDDLKRSIDDARTALLVPVGEWVDAWSYVEALRTRLRETVGYDANADPQVVARALVDFTIDTPMLARAVLEAQHLDLRNPFVRAIHLSFVSLCGRRFISALRQLQG